MARIKLTIRNGPKVEREGYESLDGALEALRAHSERIRAEGRLEEVSLIRKYKPGDRVKARLEISTGGVLRGLDAGIDVMGDGEIVPFRGGVFRKPLAPEDGDTPYDAVATVLRG